MPFNGAGIGDLLRIKNFYGEHSIKQKGRGGRGGREGGGRTVSCYRSFEYWTSALTPSFISYIQITPPPFSSSLR